MKKKLLETCWPFLYISIIWFFFASPYLLKGLVPFPSKYLVTFFPPWSAYYGMPVKNNAMPDVITQIYPWKRLTIDTWKHGAIPLWNPYSFSGTVHAANYQSAVFSPMNLLFFVLPEKDAWSLLVLLQPLLAGVFMYVFLKSLSISPKAALLGSVGFMFCGFMVVWMAYGTLGYAVVSLPLLLYAVKKYSDTLRFRYLVLVSFGLAASFFSGHFQMSLYVAGLTMLYILFGIHPGRGKKQTVLMVFWLFGILLSSIQIFPTVAAYMNSVRSVAFAKGEIIPWQYLMTVFAPDFYGNPVTRNDWFGHYAEWSSYVGVVPLILSFYVVLRKKKDPVEWFFSLTAIATLLLAFQTPLVDLLYQLKLPVLSTSAASRIIVLTSFSLCVLSALGIDRLVSDWKSKKTGTAAVLSLFIGFLFLGVLGWLYIAKPLPWDKFMIARRNSLLPLGFLSLSVCVLWIGFWQKKYTSLLLCSILLVFASFDSVRFAKKWMSFDPKEFVYPQIDVITFLTKTVGFNRVFGNFGNELATYFSIPSIEGYDAVYNRRYGEFLMGATTGHVRTPERSVALLPKRGEHTEEALELLGVHYILQRKSDGRFSWTYGLWEYPWYRRIYEDSQYEVFENQNALPRAFLASSYTIAADNESIIDRLFAADFDRRNSIVLEQKPALEPQAGVGSALIFRYEPEEVIVNTSAAVDKLLFLSDAYDPGWQAFMDGKKTRLYRADYDFRAVAVPKGIHTVRFVYAPDSVRYGNIVTFLTFGIVVLLFIQKEVYAHRHL